MALIEQLEGPNWQSFLHDCFGYTLDVLKNDPSRSVGSSADDLRSWLKAGGIPRVQQQLDRQVEIRRFPPEKRAEIQKFVVKLAQEYRGPLVELSTKGVLPITMKEELGLDTLSSVNISTLIDRIIAGERPFEDWMYAHGHTEKEILEVYQVIDKWLIDHGIIS